MQVIKTRFTEHAGIEYPIICGAMFPCSHPTLISAVSEAGGIGIVQPTSFERVHNLPLLDGIKMIKDSTNKPWGINILVEQTVKRYEMFMRKSLDIALDQGCKFAVTALGHPRWVVDKVNQVGGAVYHDTTNFKHAQIGIDCGVKGLICVNNRAGGHAGHKSPQILFDELKSFGVPLICAGGIGDEAAFCDALGIGFDGVQMGTRFIATTECVSHQDYKDAIVRAEAKDIVLTERVTTVPLSVINTPHVQKMGLKLNYIERQLNRYKKTRHWMRTLYNWLALFKVANSSKNGLSTKDYYQAGKSVDGIERVEPVAAIVQRFIEEYHRRQAGVGK